MNKVRLYSSVGYQYLCFIVRFQGSTFTLHSAINSKLWDISEASSYLGRKQHNKVACVTLH